MLKIAKGKLKEEEQS